MLTEKDKQTLAEVLVRHKPETLGIIKNQYALTQDEADEIVSKVFAICHAVNKLTNWGTAI